MGEMRRFDFFVYGFYTRNLLFHLPLSPFLAFPVCHLYPGDAPMSRAPSESPDEPLDTQRSVSPGYRAFSWCTFARIEQVLFPFLATFPIIH